MVSECGIRSVMSVDQSETGGKDLDFQDLNAFIHVARQGSFSGAAAQLRTAQSALSRRVLKLEHKLGVQLLVRHARGVSLTPAGEVLLARAHLLVEEMGTIVRSLSELTEEPSGELRLAFPPTTGQLLAPAIMMECRRRFPKLRLRLLEGLSDTIHCWLNEGSVDIAVLYDPEASSKISSTPLITEPLYLVSHAKEHPGGLPVIEHSEFRLRDLEQLPLILPSRPQSIRVLLERFAAEHRYRLNVVGDVNSIRTIKGLVQAGLGYTIFSHAGIHEEVDAGVLKVIPLRPVLRWTLAIAHDAENASLAVREVKDLIVRQMHVLYKNGFYRGDFHPAE